MRSSIMFLFLLLSNLFFFRAFARPSPYLFDSLPGVGFSLMPDYGTVVLYHSQNESITEVARVEGSHDYKAFMRQNEKLCHLRPPSQCSFESDMANRHQVAARDLLASLQASATRAIGTGFCFVGLSIPHRNTYQQFIIEKSLRLLGLQKLCWTWSNSAAVASFKDDDFEEYLDTHPDGPIALSLVVDHSLYGLSVDLYEHDGVVKSRINGSTYLHRPNDTEVQYWGNVQTSLANALHTLQNHAGIIHSVLVYGDAVHNSTFREILQSVLGPDLIQRVHTFDSIFSTAAPAAETLWKYQIQYNSHESSLVCHDRGRHMFIYHPV